MAETNFEALEAEREIVTASPVYESIPPSAITLVPLLSAAFKV